MLQAGRLRHRVTLQTSAPGRDAVGGVTKIYTDWATVWGEVRDIGGKEFFSAQAVQSEVTTRIKIRARAGVVPTMRALWAGRTFDIQAVTDPDGRGAELHLLCEEVR